MTSDERRATSDERRATSDVAVSFAGVVEFTHEAEHRDASSRRHGDASGAALGRLNVDAEFFRSAEDFVVEIAQQSSHGHVRISGRTTSNLVHARPTGSPRSQVGARLFLVCVLVPAGYLV